MLKTRKFTEAMQPLEPATLPANQWLQDPALAGECFINNVYQVMVREAGEGPFGRLLHLSIKRLDRQPIHDWRDLQWIKNQLCGPEAEGIEIYPAESRLVDTSNQYHLFVFLDCRLPFGFDQRAVSETSLDLGQQPGMSKAQQRPFAPHVRPQDLAESSAKLAGMIAEKKDLFRA